MADAAKSGFGDIRCHQMSPDVRILTDNQAVILLFKSGYWNKIWSEKTSFCVNVAWQSEFMRILCSSEQSKLCPCPTKVFCRTRTNLPAPRAGESAPKSRILEEKVQTKNLMCMEKTTGIRTGKAPKRSGRQKYSFRLNAEKNIGNPFDRRFVPWPNIKSRYPARLTCYEISAWKRMYFMKKVTNNPIPVCLCGTGIGMRRSIHFFRNSLFPIIHYNSNIMRSGR